jgi:hypothetical protein
LSDLELITLNQLDQGCIQRHPANGFNRLNYVRPESTTASFADPPFAYIQQLSDVSEYATYNQRVSAPFQQAFLSPVQPIGCGQVHGDDVNVHTSGQDMLGKWFSKYAMFGENISESNTTRISGPGIELFEKESSDFTNNTPRNGQA